MLLLTLATLLTFAPSLGHEFVTDWDDQLYVTGNYTAWSFSVEHLHQAFTRFFVGNYAPLQIVSYMLDSTLWGLRPAGFIATNLLLHLTNGLLYYLLVWKLTARRSWACAAAAIFLLHPVQVESAVWISQRKNVLAMCLFLLAMLLYLGYQARSGRSRSFWYIGSLAAFLGALLTKSVVVILPLVLVVHDFCFLEQKERRRWLLDKVPYFILATVIGLVAIRSQSPHLDGGAATAYHGGTPLTTFFTMVPVMVRYLGMLFWPAGLSAYYDVPVKPGIDLEVASAGLLLLALATGAMALARRNRQLFFWVALLLLGILPVAQIIPLVTIMNDRYLYFPMLGGAALVTAFIAGPGAHPALGQRKIFMPLLLLLIVTLALLSNNRARVWQNSFTLWSDAHMKFPASTVVNFGMGSIHLQNSEPERALGYFLKAYQQGMREKGLLLNLGRTSLLLGDLAQAQLFIKELLTIYPDYPLGWMLLGDYRTKLGNEAGAAEAFNRAVTLQQGIP
jgi:hypothetical protein